MRYFFIDLENVRSEGLEGVASLAADDMVFIYYSENAMNLSIPTLENLNNSKASKKFIKTNYIGKNAMDFQIVSLFGAMIERNRQGSYYIISQDNGFRSAVSFCESYFEDYHIICGVAPTIISAITEDMKKTAAASATSAGSASQPAQKARKKKHKTSSGAQAEKNESTENAVQADKKMQTEKAAKTEKSEQTEKTDRTEKNEQTAKPQKEAPAQAADDAKPRFGYIYEALSELLSEKTIDIYAATIDEAIETSANKNELHDFYKNRFGEDEGEALYKITQGDFELLKKARPKEDASQDKAPAAPARKRSRHRHRSKKNHSEEPQTIS